MQVNPLTPRQETICLLQNATSANNPSAQPLKVGGVSFFFNLYHDCSLLKSKSQKSGLFRFILTIRRLIVKNGQSLS
jgi:hypothetical protein